MMETILKKLKGFLYSFILFILLTLLMGVIMKLTIAPEGWSIYYMIAILSICCFFLGIYIGNHVKKRGIIYGTLYSIIFILILSVIYTLFFSAGIAFGAGLLKFLIPVLFGSVGGMIGVNLQS